LQKKTDVASGAGGVAGAISADPIASGQRSVGAGAELFPRWQVICSE
jgi:hypothetical protein